MSKLDQQEEIDEFEAEEEQDADEDDDNETDAEASGPAESAGPAINHTRKAPKSARSLPGRNSVRKWKTRLPRFWRTVARLPRSSRM